MRIVGYKQPVLRMLGLTSQPSLVRIPVQSSTDEEEEFNEKLTSTIDLVLVDDVKIEPAGESLFNHPNNKVLFLLCKLSFSLIKIYEVYGTLLFIHR